MALPNFSGEWELVNNESEFGFLKAPGLRTDSIDHQEPELRILTRQVDTNGDITVERRLTVGGEAVEIKIRERVRQIRAQWDGRVLIIKTHSEVSGHERRIEDRWSMSVDGQIVTIRRFHELPGGAVRQELALRRRASQHGGLP